MKINTLNSSEGKIKITYQPYIHPDIGFYMAHGVRRDGKSVTIKWWIIKGEEKNSDWNHFTVFED